MRNSDSIFHGSFLLSLKYQKLIQGFGEGVFQGVIYVADLRALGVISSRNMSLEEE